jgi:flagellar protein FlbB
VATYSGVGGGPRIFVLLLLLLVLFAGGAIWFDVLGIIDVQQTFAPLVRPVMRLFGAEPRADIPDVDEPFLLEGARLEKEREALVELRRSLDEREQTFLQTEAEVQQRLAAIEEREQALAEREESFNQRVNRYENRRANIVDNVQSLNNMPLEDAVGILQGYDDALLIETLRVADELAEEAGTFSLVSTWLSRLPPERAAEIQRKMVNRPD